MVFFTMSTGYRQGAPFGLELWEIGKTADGTRLLLAKEAAQQFLRMAEAAEADGIRLVVNTAFREHAHQDRLYRRYMTQLAEWQKGGRLGKRPATAAAPGFSTHQQGLSVDINRAPGDDPATAEADSPVDKWLAANAARFGFVNDVASEPWHWSYLPARAALRK